MIVTKGVLLEINKFPIIFSPLVTITRIWVPPRLAGGTQTHAQSTDLVELIIFKKNRDQKSFLEKKLEQFDAETKKNFFLNQKCRLTRFSLVEPFICNLIQHPPQIKNIYNIKKL